MLQRGVQRVKKATIADINRLAAELGMSYGKYVAASRSCVTCSAEGGRHGEIDRMG